jgi:hypothetical protein
VTVCGVADGCSRVAAVAAGVEGFDGFWPLVLLFVVASEPPPPPHAARAAEARMTARPKRAFEIAEMRFMIYLS